jgi:hypothetical protein
MEAVSSHDKASPRRRTVAGKISIVISIMIIAVIVIAGWALVNQSNGQSESPFLSYPLHVDKYNVQQFSNESFKFTVWVENQNYSSANSGFIHCILILDPYKGCAGFSSDQITLEPGERHMFTVWSPPPIASEDINWTSYDCQILQ